MSNPAEELGPSILDTVSKSPLPDALAELGEAGLDRLLADGLLQDLPIIGTLSALWKTGLTIKDALFTRKLLRLLLPVLKVRPEVRERMIRRLKQDPSSPAEVGEHLISLLDRLDSSAKAQVVGNAFVAYLEERIGAELFWRVAFAIDRVPFQDLLLLREWRETEPNQIPHVQQQMFLTAGLMWFVLDFSSTGFVWSEELCDLVVGCLPQPPRPCASAGDRTS